MNTQEFEVGQMVRIKVGAHAGEVHEIVSIRHEIGAVKINFGDTNLIYRISEIEPISPESA